MLGHMMGEQSRKTLRNLEKLEDQKEHLYKRTKMTNPNALLKTWRHSMLFMKNFVGT